MTRVEKWAVSAISVVLVTSASLLAGAHGGMLTSIFLLYLILMVW